MLRLSAELTFIDSCLISRWMRLWKWNISGLWSFVHVHTFLTRKNQSQLAASAIYHILPLITEHATFSPRDFCGEAGANFTGKLIFRSEYATSRCFRALAQNAASSLQRCWGLEVLYRKQGREKGAGAMTAIKSKSADVKWGRHGYATPRGI